MEEKEMLVGRCLNCEFCTVSKRPSYTEGYKKEITLICEVTGQTLKIEKCPWFY